MKRRQKPIIFVNINFHTLWINKKNKSEREKINTENKFLSVSQSILTAITWWIPILGCLAFSSWMFLTSVAGCNTLKKQPHVSNSKGNNLQKLQRKKNAFFGVICSEQTIPIKSILLATTFLDQKTKSSISTWRKRLLTRLYTTSNSLSLPTEVTLALLCWESWLIFCHDKQINNNIIIIM